MRPPRAQMLLRWTPLAAAALWCAVACRWLDAANLCGFRWLTGRPCPLCGLKGCRHAAAPKTADDPLGEPFEGIRDGRTRTEPDHLALFHDLGRHIPCTPFRLDDIVSIHTEDIGRPSNKSGALVLRTRFASAQRTQSVIDRIVQEDLHPKPLRRQSSSSSASPKGRAVASSVIGVTEISPSRTAWTSVPTCASSISGPLIQ